MTRLKITRVTLADAKLKLICGEAQPKECFVNINALRQLRVENHETFLVMHDRPKGVGDMIVFYAGRDAVLKMEPTFKTLPGQSYSIEATH
jgi:hypothetical protein